ncbi:MAG: S8 family serine peptidase, partial [Candidatus Aminicenantes bacterium]|nr:S8 family serine peptidase [Candidatus Aminicenantes bacterium]
MKQRLLCIFRIAIILNFAIVFVPARAGQIRQETENRLNQIFKEARAEFFSTVDKILEKHFRKVELRPEDLERIANASKEIPSLFERIMILAYQKDEPVYASLIQKGDESSLQFFKEKFIALARDYAARFVGSLFRKQPQADFAMMLPHNQGKSTLDLVLQTLGYSVKTELPDYPKEKWFTNEIESDLESQWGIDAVKARECWSITRGEGVVVAVIDSGIDPYNSLFEKRTIPGVNFVGKTTPPWSEENPPMIDYGLHGTGVSSALLAIAPECKIMPIRIHDSDTMNDPPFDYWLTEQAAAGIYWAVHHGAHVISKSSRLLPAEPVVGEAVRYANEHNVVICSSAGNIPRVHLGLRPEETLYRAFDKEVLLIGGVEKDRDKIRAWPYSVPGDFVDVAAPSQDVFVLVPVYMKGMKNLYVAGTSLAAPIAAGVVALMRSAAPPSRGLLGKP